MIENSMMYMAVYAHSARGKDMGPSWIVPEICIILPTIRRVLEALAAGVAGSPVTKIRMIKNSTMYMATYAHSARGKDMEPSWIVLEI